MQHIDFHILDTTSKQRACLFICQYIEKYFLENKRIYLHLSNQDDVTFFDKLLWTFKDDSFIPHDICSEGVLTPVQLGYAEPLNKDFDMLINFSQDFLDCYNQYPHIVEIVYADQQFQQLARERYKKYRDAGNDIKTYKEK